ncbi:MAG: ATP-dependent zinc metalloprotease FtsH [Thermoanaerobaculia bacterium]|nr:ATP-dependent zinc metalloprotease FtsH [Thermoanaerobaculia bacterium]
MIWMLILLAVVWLWQLSAQAGGAPTIGYDTFRDQLEEGSVSSVRIRGQEIQGELVESRSLELVDGRTTEIREFVTVVPSTGDEELLADLRGQGVEIVAEPEQQFPWTFLLVTMLPFFLILGLGVMIMRRMQSRGRNLFGFGKSKAKVYQRSKEETTFEDVAGAEGPKRELMEVIEFLRDPRRFQRLGGQIPHGILLQGPPGTGKTLMARAVAGEADVPFFSVTGSDFVEMFVGVGASRVRSMFEEAKKVAPAILFIDELDSIGRARGAGLGGGHDEREQTLNQLLSEMDGFEKFESVVVMASTNRPDVLDKALLRPGRFDRVVTVDLPTRSSRERILQIHARGKPLAEDLDLGTIARTTQGFSGADLENLLNEAALIAARRDKEAIDSEDVEEARDKVMLGLEREGLHLSDEDLKSLAYHEGGHAVLAVVLDHVDPLHKVTIVPRGRAMGVTQVLPEEERYIFRKEYLVDRLVMTMGGRAAERLVFDTATSGAENDLRQATRMARKMVVDWGMSDRFGHISLGGEGEDVFLGQEIARRRNYSDATAKEVDDEVDKILEAAFRRATELLEEHREGLDRLAQVLLEEEEIPGKRVLEILGLGPEEAEEEMETATEVPPPD